MGGFAEEALADASAVVKLSPGADVAAAAGLPIAYGTSHVALLHRCRLTAGQSVMVLGAAGGVGLAAVQVPNHPSLVGSPPLFFQ
jgi:NADPH:quinone reductase-like Zn-dependent oxidoreductase